MSGYKRVNFYELCRLCATNQQKEKTHIFQEEGRKIQLQNKIQNCLSLKVCENDFLPKVVCSQCLHTLEECFLFRKECYNSETMLSSYFNNFRYTDDFKKSGKVYIKDTCPKVSAPQTTTYNSISTSSSYNISFVPNSNVNNSVRQDTLPYYTLHLPTVVPQPQEPKISPKEIKTIPPQPQIIYNLNTIKPKDNNELLNNVTINTNGEVISITPLVDVDNFGSQSLHQKTRKLQKKPKLFNTPEKPDASTIDLTADLKLLKTPKQHSLLKQPNSKSGYVVNSSELNVLTNRNYDSQSAILTPLPKINAGTHLNINRTQKFFSFNNSNVYTANNINIDTVRISNVNKGEDVNLNAEPPPVINTNVFNYPSPKQESEAINSDLFNHNQSACTVPNQQEFLVANQNYNVGEKQEAVTKCHSCDICGKVFKRREHLYQHMKLHTGFRPFVCENCNKSFLRKEHLLRHMVAHSGQKNYTCTICDKSFSRNDNLLKHKKIHNKQNSFTCEVCQKQFVMEHYYFAHKRTHDNEKLVNQMWGLLKAV